MRDFGELGQEVKRHVSGLRGRRPFTRDMALRMLADATMVNVALLGSLTLRYLWLVNDRMAAMLEPPAFIEFLRVYVSTSWMLTLISLIAFYTSGFYTFGRVYRSRYKALVIAQAVSLSYLIFGFVLLLLREIISFPRAVLFLAWFLTLAILMGARLWATLWTTLVDAEHHLASSRPAKKEIQDILVIGGAGYIGSALVERLLGLGYKVGVLDLLIYGDASITEFYGHPNFEFIQGDFRSIDTVVRATKGRDAIIHLGGIVGDPACSICEDLTVEINLGATRTIAEIGKGFGVKRFIFASTCSVYGASDETLDERSALNPISLYARTKVESEKVLLKLTDASFAPTILRFGTIYGLSGRPRFDLVVNLLTAKAIQEGQAGIFGGTQWRPLVHVKDVAEAIVLALQASPSTVSGQIFNVGCNEQNYQIAELGPMIRDMVPNARVVVQPTEDNRNYRVRFDKIRNILNFQPQYSVLDGIAEIIEAYGAGQITDYKNPYYNNFSFLRQDGRLPDILLVDPGGWDWVRLSANEAIMLSELVMAVIESQSEELMSRLREGLAQAILGDVDGFLDTLTGIQFSSQPAPPQAVGEPVLHALPTERQVDARSPAMKPSLA